MFGISFSRNYAPYDGDASFLATTPERTRKICGHLKELFVEERTKGVFDVSQIPSSITSHSPGYIDRKNELIVGLQTEAPLYGVSRLVEGKQQEKRDLDAAMSTDDTIRDR